MCFTVVSTVFVLDSALTSRDSVLLAAHCNLRSSSVVVSKVREIFIAFLKLDGALPVTDTVVFYC